MGLFRKFAANYFDDNRLNCTLSQNPRIPPFLRFNRQRSMPIMKLKNQRGYYMFPSIQSYEKFRSNGDDISLNQDGVGVPLFYFERTNYNPLDVGIVSEANLYKIHIFTIQDSNVPPPFDHEDVIAIGKKFTIYQSLFCTISREVTWNRITYKLSFRGYEDEPYLMVHRPEFRDLDTKIDGFVLRWHVAFNPVIDNDHYGLRLLYNDEKSLFDSMTKSKPNVDEKGRSVITKPIPESQKMKISVAHYTSEDSDDIKIISYKMADVTIGENGSPNAFGIKNVPMLTKILACETLLIHRIEVDKDKEAGNKRWRYRNPAMNVMNPINSLSPMNPANNMTF